MKSLRVIVVIAAFIGAGFLLCPRAPGVHQVDPDALLDNVIKAEASVPYSAEQVYEIVGVGKVSRQRVNRSFSAISDEPVFGRYYRYVKSNYVPMVEGEDRVAGRDAWTLRLMPNRDKYPWRRHAPWKQLWVDKETCVVLASREWTSTNKLKRRTWTEAITFGKPRALPELPMASGPDSSALASLRNDERYKRDMEGFVPKYVPGGFHLEDARCSSESGCRFVYTDGLYCIEITGDLDTHTADNRDAGIRDCGQCLVYTRVSNSRSFTVTADLPSNEFRKLIESIR